MTAGNNPSSKRVTRQARDVVARARTAGRRATPLWVAAGVLVTAALVGVLIIAITGHTGTHPSDTASPSLNSAPATVAVGAETPPPWPAPADVGGAVAAAGLPMLGAEGTTEHIHVHLDVLENGRAVPVPAGIGIDVKNRRISPLHTHDDSGVIHIESPVKRDFSLGEFFSEWQVSLSQNNIGALRAGDGHTLRVFVNGALRQGNPAAITFAPHDEIAIVYGTPEQGEWIPAKYEFPAGD
jgi:hypothetical protein